MSAKLINRTTWLVFVVFAVVMLPQGQTLAQSDTFGDVLVGHRWDIRSESLGSGLAGTSLDATFMSDGSFVGMLNPPPGDRLVIPQQVNGRWQVAGPLLYLSYNYLMGGYPSPTQIPIEITEISQNKLVGVDKFYRLWEFSRIR